VKVSLIYHCSLITLGINNDVECPQPKPCC
jgi:hypothetical protein